MKFDAFISYSHARDLKLASALHTSLHRLGKPWYKPRALRIFRDQTDLSVNPNLWDSILNGLGQSRFFILMACPKAAASKWVDQEVAFWAMNKPTDKILLVLTEGEIFWDATAGDFDWNKTTAIPASLKGVFKGEPLWVDFRELRSQSDLSLANPAFQDKAVYLAATLHGKSPAEMVGEEMMQHRKTIRIRNAAIGVLALLTLVSVVAAGFAFWQRDLATDRLRIATSSDLSSQAALAISHDPTLAFQLADSALEMVDTNRKAQDVIFQVVHQATRFPLYSEIAAYPGIVEGKISHDGKRFFLARGKSLIVLDPCTNPLEEIQLSDSLLSFALSPSDTLIALLTTNDKVFLLDLQTKALSDLKKGPIIYPNTDIAFSPAGNFVIASTEAYGVQIYDIREQQWQDSIVNDSRNSMMAYSSFIAVSQDDHYAAMCFAEDDFHVLDLATGNIVAIEKSKEYVESTDTTAFQTSPSSCVFDGQFLRVKAGDFVIQVDLKSGFYIAKPIFSHGVGSKIPFDGHVDFAGDQSGIAGHLLTNGYRIRFDEHLNIVELTGTGIQNVAEIQQSSIAGVLLAIGNDGGIQWTNASNWKVSRNFLVDHTAVIDFGLDTALGLRAILDDGRIVQWGLDQWVGGFAIEGEGEHMEYQPNFSLGSNEVYLFLGENSSIENPEMKVFDMEGNFLRTDSMPNPEFDMEWGPLSWWRGLSNSDLGGFSHVGELAGFLSNFQSIKNAIPGDPTQIPVYRLSLDHRHMLLYWTDSYRPIPKSYLFPTQASEVAMQMRKKLAKPCVPIVDK